MAFPNHLSQEMGLQHFGDNHLPDNSSSVLVMLPDGKASEQQQRPPTWLNSAILRQQPPPNNHLVDSNFLNLQSTNSGSSSPAAANNQWLSRSILQRSGDVQVSGESMMISGDYNRSSESVENWEHGRYKAEILSHPLYEQLLSAHVACLRIATPVDQLPRIDAQLAQSDQIVNKYSAIAHQNLDHHKDLDQFMVF